MVILIADRFDPSLADRLEELGEVTDDLSRLPEADVLIVRSKTKCTREFLERADNLRLIIRGGVGLDNIDLVSAGELGIAVQNTPRASAVAVAELTLALMLAASSRVIEAHNSMAAGEWKKGELKRSELFGKRLCLVGLGSIATEVAVRARAFGMTVQGFRRSGRPHELARVLESLESAVEGADYVSLHLPLTSETQGIIQKGIIAHMKRGVVLINTSRAGCVATEDVLEALKSEQVAVYAVDVWPSDPPAADFPLLGVGNVIMTPHIGASTKENLLRIGEEVYNAVTNFQTEHV